ncbi:MAG: topoisomerase C-terminal repeat-containing protein [Spirochaetes bacterium]|nr:topoisomerase C-terminal repeat-containing protein [Spirochaetota bacterium]
MKTLIIAEKPNVMRKLKAMLELNYSIRFRNIKNYFESEEYYLSSFFGHLLELYMPDDYGYTEWKASDLPIIPEKFEFKYKGDTESQGKLLVKLSRECSSIINASDPDREGEGIFRTWYNFEGIKLPVKRFWSKSLAQHDLAKNWLKLLPSSDFDNLGAAQSLRQEADWLIGMNGSRAYSIAGNSRLSIGRVQTATLALIVKRDQEVESYTESFFYSLSGQWNSLPFMYFDDNGTKFENEQALSLVKTECDLSEFQLEKFEQQQKTQNPPMPFSLHELQKVANEKFNFSLDRTLAIAQSLYEKGLTTYPRTSSSCLPPADLDTYYDVINKFADQREKDLLVPKGQPINFIKETEASHTAIIPTGEVPQQLEDDENKLYVLILKRFIISFLKPRIYIQYFIRISNGKHHFRTTVNKTSDPGFTLLSTEKKEDDQETDSDERDITVELSKESLPSKRFEKLELFKKKRSKPKYFTPGTLVTAMMNVGRSMEKKEYKDILNEVEGLGTEATRQLVPVELEIRNYIEKSGKFLKSTVKGRQLIAWVKPEVKTPELTAQWESKLRSIERGKYDASKFCIEIRDLTRQIVVVDNDLKNQFTTALDEAKRKCPKCKRPLNENSFGYFCEKTCGFALWKIISQKKLSMKDIDTLFSDGKTGIIDGFKKKEGNGTYSARIVIESPDFKPKFSFDTSSDYKCPLCGGVMQSYSSNLRCKSCDFSVWYSMSGKKLSESAIKSLLFKGRTPVIKGFVSAKTGKSFDAALRIDQEAKKVVFDFS